MPSGSTTADPPHFKDHVEVLINDLADLSPFQRRTIIERYRHLMADYRFRCRFYAILYNLLRIIITIGSLAVPALLSTETFRSENTSATQVIWFTWSLSLAVTTSNAILTLFKLDKRFSMIHSTAERLRSETWQYLQLAGRYSGGHGSHAAQFVNYCSEFEKINMKCVEDEFIKGGDDKHPSPQLSITDLPLKAAHVEDISVGIGVGAIPVSVASPVSPVPTTPSTAAAAAPPPKDSRKRYSLPSSYLTNHITPAAHYKDSLTQIEEELPENVKAPSEATSL